VDPDPEVRRHAGDADAVGVVHGEVFETVRPASTMVVVAGLLDRGGAKRWSGTRWRRRVTT